MYNIRSISAFLICSFSMFLNFDRYLRSQKSSRAGPLNIGVKPGSPFAMASLPRYLNICGYPDRSNGMNIPTVVKEYMLMISAAVSSSPANYVVCFSRKSSSFSTFLGLASTFLTIGDLWLAVQP